MYIALAVLLAVLPFVTGAALGRGWVRILDFTLLYVMLALGLNIVVGYAGLLDLGYIAFYAVGAYMYALLASPHFDLHLPFWALLPLGAGLAGIFGILLGAPTLRLRGDYLAIVTLGFGEIIRIFLNNLNSPVNITNGPQGVNLIDPVAFGGFSLSQPHEFFGVSFPGLYTYYYLFLVLTLLVIFVSLRLDHDGAQDQYQRGRGEQERAVDQGGREPILGVPASLDLEAPPGLQHDEQEHRDHRDTGCPGEPGERGEQEGQADRGHRSDPRRPSGQRRPGQLLAQREAARVGRRRHQLAPENSRRRSMMIRATMFTSRVMMNRTRPEAIRAPSPIVPASPHFSAMFEANVVPPGSEMCQLIRNAGEISSATAMVSPRARPRPSIAALIMPGRPKGKIAVRTISQRVAPRASAASM